MDSKIIVSPESLFIGAGANAQLTVTLDPVVEDSVILYESIDPKVTLPDSTGKVYGYHNGITNLKITYKAPDEQDNWVFSKCYEEVQVTVGEIATNPEDIYPTIAVNQEVRIEAVALPEGASLTSGTATGTISLTRQGTTNVFILKGVSIGTGSITFTGSYDGNTFTRVIEIKVAAYFTPVTSLTDEIIKSLKIHDTESELMIACSGYPMMFTDATDTVPKLYYKKINENPQIFEYELQALSSDIDRFTLGKL